MTANPTRTYYPALDGLRGVAILLVILAHNFGFLNYFFFGWLGVDLFFVLSGFLITEILLKTLNGPHFLRNFYVRRVLRIFPLYYLAIIVATAVLPWIVPSYVNMSFYAHNRVWFWVYLQNWLFIFKTISGTHLLLHTWSLAVEEQYYLIWPLLILLFKTPKRLLVVSLTILLLVGIGRFIVWELQFRDLAYNSLYTFTRIDGLCIGSAIAIIMRINPAIIRKYTPHIAFSMAGINFVFYFLNRKDGISLPYLALVGYTTFAVLFGLLVYEAVRGDNKWVQLLLDNKLLKFLGRISYGLYVFHWPIFLLFSPVFYKYFHIQVGLAHLPSSVAAAIIDTVIAVVISWLSYRYFESIFLRMKKKFA